MGRVGVVLVSHSRPLAEAALELALAMVPADPPTVALAAGSPAGDLGTDPLRVAAALAEADSGAGVVVLSDLGSALLSAELALELGDPARRVQLVAAPFVEGLVAALVAAAAGAPLEAVAAAAREALSPKLAHLEAQAPPPPAIVGPTTGPVITASLAVVNAGGMHARPAAAIATLVGPLRAAISIRNAQGEQADASSPIALGLLAAAPGDRLTVTAVGEDAEQAVQRLTAAFASGFGEELVPAAAAAIPRQGLGVSPGRVCGPVRRITAALSAPPAAPPLPPPGRAAAMAALEAARERVVADLRSRAGSAAAPHAALLTALAAMAADPSLAEAARRSIEEQGLSAEAAWWQSVSAVADRYRAAGGRRAERACDLLDLRDRVIRLLRGEAPAPAAASEASIWVADELAPIDLATLPAGACLGIVTAGGGPTSHVAILARELGIPAVVGARGILGLSDGTMLLLDGSSGALQVDPPPAALAAGTAEPPPGGPSSRPLSGPGSTADGVPVALLANVSGPRDNAEAVDLGAEGVGLLRTEFCFPQGQGEPTLAEQIERYTSLLAAWPGRRVWIRSLDAGADKPLAWLGLDPEANPALGIRGFRTARRRPEVLTRQLQAIAAAARRCEAEVWVMAPMITTVAEAESFVAQARAAGLPRAGVMVETPAAALCADALCAVVDGLSLGTNDLLQYTLAADRAAPALADLASPWQPALLRLIAMVAEAAQRHGVPVGICGEAAGRADLAPVLVGLGVRSLSMAPRALPAVAAAVASVGLDTARAMAAAALRADTPEAAIAASARQARISSDESSAPGHTPAYRSQPGAP